MEYIARLKKAMELVEATAGERLSEKAAENLVAVHKELQALEGALQTLAIDLESGCCNQRGKRGEFISRIGKR